MLIRNKKGNLEFKNSTLLDGIILFTDDILRKIIQRIDSGIEGKELKDWIISEFDEYLIKEG